MSRMIRPLRVAIAAIALTCFAMGSVAYAEQTADPKRALVNINKAEAAELTSLPGIGEKKAQAIIDYRKANGPFKKIDDLQNVKGIGAKTLAKLRPLVTLAAVDHSHRRMTSQLS